MVMAFMSEIREYKKKLMKLFWESQSIREIIAKSANSSPLTYTQFREHVKRYGRHPDTITNKGVYLLFEVEPIKARTATVMNYAIYVWVIASEDVVETDSGEILTDILAEEVDKILNQNASFGIGPLMVQGAPTFSTPKGFCGRKITYMSPDFNGRR